MQEIGTVSAKPNGNIQHALTLGKKEYEKKKNNLMQEQKNKKKMTHPWFG
jgi:hypothetical protein